MKNAATLRQYKDYNDFLKNFEKHQDLHEARGKVYREEGFENLNDKFGAYYDHFEQQDNPNSQMNQKYYVYKERYYERFWDTKDNHDYYSQPLSTRMWI